MSISQSVYATIGGLLVAQNTFAAASADTYFGSSKATAIAGGTGAATPYQAITNIIVALLSLITLVAVAYVLWAGFQILTAWGDEEKVKSGRKTIINVIIGIVVMWLAYWIVTLILNALV
jgi:threonine/homoserine/homoserine lactone efflux protein